MRKGKWKIVKREESTELYNLEEDISEKYNLFKDYPEIVKELTEKLEEFDNEITRNARPVGEL